MCKVQRGTLGVDMTWYIWIFHSKQLLIETQELILTPIVSITLFKKRFQEIQIGFLFSYRVNPLVMFSDFYAPSGST